MARDELTRRVSKEPIPIKFNDDKNTTSGADDSVSVIRSSHHSHHSELEEDAKVILDDSDAENVDVESKTFRSNQDDKRDRDGGMLSNVVIASAIVAVVGIAAFYFMRRR